jgi:hypothetical protein
MSSTVKTKFSIKMNLLCEKFFPAVRDFPDLSGQANTLNIITSYLWLIKLLVRELNIFLRKISSNLQGSSLYSDVNLEGCALFISGEKKSLPYLILSPNS